MVANIVKYILDNFQDSNTKEITRCLNKATIIVFDNTSILVADKEYVYYFGSTASTLNTVKFYRKTKHLISGKVSYTKNRKIVKAMARQVIGTANDGTTVCILK